MEHFIRIAFWIFSLSATFSSCHPKPLRLSDAHIKSMEREVKCPADSKFYTPQNVKVGCIESALECVRKELNTAKWECDDEKNRTHEAIYSLERYLGNTAPSVPDGCTCESYPQNDFKEFLKKYKELIQCQNNSNGR